MSQYNVRSFRPRKNRTRVLLTESLESRQLLATVPVGFADLPLHANSHWNGPDVAGIKTIDEFGGDLTIGNFQSRGVAFENRFTVYDQPEPNPDFTAWSGFAYSNEHDRATAGFSNQYSSYNAGATGGFDDANFGVAYGYTSSPFDPDNPEHLATLPHFALPANGNIVDAKVTNTTYSALAMLNGDDFTTPFGTPTGDPDFLKITAYGVGADGNTLPDSADFFLADYRFADNSQDYVLDTWSTFDLSPLAGARSIYFHVTSSDPGAPTYFAIDAIRYNLPEPNAAPVLNDSLNPTLFPINEDAANPGGTPVSSLISGAVTDTNANALRGIAVTVAQNSPATGYWEFTRNGGNVWQPMGNPTPENPRLLASDLQTRVRFVPFKNFNGQVSLSFRAWDQTQGTPGGRLTTAGRIGGIGSFSTASDTASLTVNAVNDAPVLAKTPLPSLGVVASNTPEAEVPGVAVSTLLTGASDVDAGATLGIAVVGLTEKFLGTWQYSSDGETWLALGAPTDSSAVRLAAADQVRFVPNAGYYGTPQLRFRAWDRTDGAAPGTTGTTVGQTGGTKAYSTVAVSAKLTVEANPVLNVGGTIGYVRNSSPTTLAQTATVSDVDSPDFGQGSLFIRITTGGENANRLQIGSQFTIQATGDIKFGATLIGNTTAPGGVSSTNLLINFNSNATASIVQTLVRSITFGTVTGASAGTRTILFTLTDGDGGSVERTKLVNVT